MWFSYIALWAYTANCVLVVDKLPLFLKSYSGQEPRAYFSLILLKVSKCGGNLKIMVAVVDLYFPEFVRVREFICKKLPLWISYIAL